MSLTERVSDIVENSTNPLLAVHHTWRRVSLGEIADILNGFPFESSKFSKREGKPLLRIRDVGKTSTDCGYVGDYDRTFLVRRGDLIVGMDGDFNSASWQGPAALLNQRVCKLSVVTEGYDKRFLEFALPGYLKAINDATSSVTVKHLSSRSVAEIPLPLPPLPEQRRIVAKIEELFSKLDAGVEELKKARAQLKRYRQSVLKAAFSGELTKEWRKAKANRQEPIETAQELLERIRKARANSEEANRQQPRSRRQTLSRRKYKEPPPLDTSDLPDLPEGWAYSSVGDVALLVTKGSTPTSYGFSYVKAGIRYVKVENIASERINADADMQFIASDAHSFLLRSQLASGDVLYTIAGTIGKVAIVYDGDLPANTNQAVAIIRVPSDHVRPDYLKYALMSPRAKESILRRPRGVGMSNVSLGDVKDLVFGLPSWDEQAAVVEEVDRRLSVTDAEEKAIEAALRQAGRLRQSILKRAFEGRLVPQDPNDPPATELLERIRAEKVRLCANKRTRGQAKRETGLPRGRGRRR